jgi:hypothetical protein
MPSIIAGRRAWWTNIERPVANMPFCAYAAWKVARAAGCQLRRKKSELGFQLHAQFLNCVLQPAVGGNLLGL